MQTEHLPVLEEVWDSGQKLVFFNLLFPGKQ